MVAAEAVQLLWHDVGECVRLDGQADERVVVVRICCFVMKCVWVCLLGHFVLHFVRPCVCVCGVKLASVLERMPLRVDM